MCFNDFVTLLNERVNELLDEDTSSRIETVTKNNGGKRTGLLITRKNSNFFSAIYLEEYYEYELCEIGLTIDEIARDLIVLYKQMTHSGLPDAVDLRDFNKVKAHLAIKLINREKNEPALDKVPYIPYLDLAVVFYLLIRSRNVGAATVNVTHQLASLWQTDAATLYRLALANAPRILKAEFLPIREVIGELSGGLNPEGDEDILRDGKIHGQSHAPGLTRKDRDFFGPETAYKNPRNLCRENPADTPSMYILSNNRRQFGASCILYGNMLANISKRLGGNYYILPSSIHEVIILPASGGIKSEELDKMISEINRAAVSEQDVLSDHAYYYNRFTDKVTER